MKDLSPGKKIVKAIFPAEKSQKSQLCLTKLKGNDGKNYSFITAPSIVRSSMTHTIDEVFEEEASQKDASVYALYQDEKYNSIDQDSNSFKLLKAFSETVVKNIDGLDKPHSICSGEISHSGCYFDASDLYNDALEEISKTIFSKNTNQSDEEKIEAFSKVMDSIYKISPFFTKSMGRSFASFHDELSTPMIVKILSKAESPKEKIKKEKRKEKSYKVFEETLKKNAIELEGNLSLDPSKNIVIFADKILSAYLISRLQESGCSIIEQDFHNVKGSLYKKGDMKFPVLTNRRDGDDKTFVPSDIFSDINILV